MAKLANIARMTTATSGTGTVTLGSAVSGYITFANAGIANGDVVTYVIEEGANREIGRGTYTSSGTTLSRDTVLNSTAGGTTKITLAGAASVFIDAAAQDIQSDVAITGGTVNDITALRVTSTDAGASVGPTAYLYRNSASPAAADSLGELAFRGKDSAANDTDYASIYAWISSPTNGAEDGVLALKTMISGTFADRWYVGRGIYASSLNDPGSGAINATAYQLNNQTFGWATVVKTSDTTRNSNTTTSADPALQISLAASTTYAIRIVVKLRSTAAGDFKWGLSGPASPTEVYGALVGASIGNANQAFEAYPANYQYVGSSSGAGLLVIEMTVENGTNAGTFSFDWAQNTSDAGPTTVKAGSYIEYRTY